MDRETVEALEELAETWRPACHIHGAPMAWWEGWGFPGWVCWRCAEGCGEESADD